jgi:hypothetical protein
MTLISQIALTTGIMANTISIIGLIRAHSKMNKRLNEIHMQCVYLSIDIGRKYGTGIPSMAEDTEVGE